MSTVNRSHEGGIFALMFTKRQPGCCGGHWVLSLSGNYCSLSIVTDALPPASWLPSFQGASATTAGPVG